MANQFAKPDAIVHLKESRLADLEARARRASRSIRSQGGTIKSAAMPVGIGALIGFLGTNVKDNQSLRENWWLLPLGIIAYGYYLSRQGSRHAQSVLAAGGILLLQGWQNRPTARPGTAPQAQPKAQPNNTQGPWADVGRISEDPSAWLQSPDGQWVRVQLQPMLRQFGPALATTSPGAAEPLLSAPIPRPVTTRLETAGPTDAVDDPAAALAAAAFAT